LCSCLSLRSPSPPTPPHPCKRCTINIRLLPCVRRSLRAFYLSLGLSCLYLAAVSKETSVDPNDILLKSRDREIVGRSHHHHHHHRRDRKISAKENPRQRGVLDCYRTRTVATFIPIRSSNKACGILVGQCTATCDPMCSGSIPALENTLRPPFGTYLLPYANSASTRDLVSTLRRENIRKDGAGTLQWVSEKLISSWHLQSPH
jgi:hypothetical protein